MKRIFAVAVALAVLLLPFACAEESGQMEKAKARLIELGYLEPSDPEDAFAIALKNFQIANGVESTGELSDATLAAIEKDTALSQAGYLQALADEYASRTPLEEGNNGEQVKYMQQALKALGYFRGECDGVFGEATLAAVKRFQVANGLRETGIAEGSTCLRLFEGDGIGWDQFVEGAVADNGDTGAHVRMLQKRLRAMGYFKGGCTGNYGNYTRQAVAQFQTNNALSDTGVADREVCVKLYSGIAIAAAQTAPRVELSYEQVVAIQTRLSELGFFDHNITGEYTATTETAVRLFQMANDLPFTGEVDAATGQALGSESAKSLGEVRESFSEMVAHQSGAALAAIGSIATQMLGKPFIADDEDLYEGFAFVQYVCVASGVPVVSPEDIVEKIDHAVENIKEAELGNLLAFRVSTAEGIHLRLAVSSGDGRVIYATQGTRWVVQSPVSEMGGGEAYRWDLSEDDG